MGEYDIPQSSEYVQMLYRASPSPPMCRQRFSPTGAQSRADPKVGKLSPTYLGPSPARTRNAGAGWRSRRRPPLVACRRRHLPCPGVPGTGRPGPVPIARDERYCPRLIGNQSFGGKRQEAGPSTAFGRVSMQYLSEAKSLARRSTPTRINRLHISGLPQRCQLPTRTRTTSILALS